MALQEEAALMAVKEALQTIPEPHHVTYHLESWRYIDDTYRLPCVVSGGTDLDVRFAALHEAWPSSGNPWKLVHAVKLCFKQVLQGVKVLHGCGWAHLGLRRSKVQVKIGSDGATPYYTVVDLSAAVGPGRDINCAFPGMFSSSHAAPELLQAVVSRGSLTEKLKMFKSQDAWSLGCLLVCVLTNCSPFVELPWPGSTAADDMEMTPEMQTNSDAYVLSRHAAWERDFDAGHGSPSGAAVLARLMPDKQQHRVVARLLQSLLQPKPACRVTVDEALNDELLHGI
ncbi:hypothetical protein ABBQ32_010706 [Trebouxia sp. C0010 RCD-2024]